ncbi:MAG: L,D-transpeptidase [Pseudomonadota bacterium]
MTNRSITFAALGAAALAASACSTSSSTSGYSALVQPTGAGAYQKEWDSGQRNRDFALAARQPTETVDYDSAYAARLDGDVSVVAFPWQKMNKKFLRQQVRYFGQEPAGTIVVDASKKFLYFVQPGGLAMRYGIAVGKEGYGWTGNSVMQWKQKWPTWTPPAEMIERKPELKKYADGLAGSPANPLGARAMYLFKDGKDTLYRIHGTDKPFSIGKAASSGCFRMINQDVMDLYDRVGGRPAVYVRPQVTQVAEFTSNR